MRPRTRQPERRGRGHHWTKFELDIVLGLICKGDHLKCSTLAFATKLNEALNGSKDHVDYDADIAVEDVRDLLADIETQKKAALAFIERQPRPHVMTRTKKRAFERNIPFTGSKKEWVAGRGDQVAAAKELEETRRFDGLETTFENVQGVQIERWVPGTPVQPLGQPVRMYTWMDVDDIHNHPIGHRMPFGMSSQGNMAGQPPYGHCKSAPSPVIRYEVKVANNSAVGYQTPMLQSGTPLDGGWARTPMLPPTTPIEYGWAAPPAAAPTPNMHSTANSSMPWAADSIQTKINAITSGLQQQAPTPQHLQPPYGSPWAQSVAPGNTTKTKENQPPGGHQASGHSN